MTTFSHSVQVPFERHSLVSAIGMLLTFLLTTQLGHRSSIAQFVLVFAFLATTFGIALSGSIRGHGANWVLSLIIALITGSVIALVIAGMLGLM